MLKNSPLPTGMETVLATCLIHGRLSKKKIVIQPALVVFLSWLTIDSKRSEQVNDSIQFHYYEFAENVQPALVSNFVHLVSIF